MAGHVSTLRLDGDASKRDVRSWWAIFGVNSL